MKNSSGNNGSARSAKANRLATISERKLQANRKNAKRSSGPKTERGKRFSRRNSFKHGFCLSHLEMIPYKENSEGLHKLIAQVRDELQPVGILEEAEVERVAICLWKRVRTWTYENAHIRGREEHVLKLVRDSGRPQRISEIDQITMSLLKSAEREVASTGQLSPDSQTKIFDADPTFRELWPEFEETALEIVSEQEQKFATTAQKAGTTRLLERAPSDTVDEPGVERDHTRLVALNTIRCAICFMQEAWKSIDMVSERILKNEFGQTAIPCGDRVETMIRYNEANERDLNRALDRLERLQRRRKGELFLPPGSVRLTR
jgi:hypothetical protein